MRQLLSLFRKIKIAGLCTLLSGCAGFAPVPGGTDDVNGSCFKSIPEMQAQIISLEPGMLESDVLSQLCRKKESFQRLERREIRIALLGGDNVSFSDHGNTETDSEIIRSLYGYKLNYKSVRRQHGFTSPIRMRTDESGYNYTLTLIFHDGKLFEKPILSGGIVNDTNSKTLFDFLTPGVLVDKAVP